MHRHRLLWCYYSEEGDDNKILSLSSLFEKKNDSTTTHHHLFLWWCYSAKGDDQAIVAFISMFEKKKKTTTASITFFHGFVAKKGDSNCHHPFRWFYFKKGDNNNVTAFFYGGGAMKKVMATIESWGAKCCFIRTEN